MDGGAYRTGPPDETPMQRMRFVEELLALRDDAIANVRSIHFRAGQFEKRARAITEILATLDPYEETTQ